MDINFNISWPLNIQLKIYKEHLTYYKGNILLAGTHIAISFEKNRITKFTYKHITKDTYNEIC